MIEIKKTRKMGRGLFAAVDLPEDVIIEVSPAVVYKFSKKFHPTDRYTFEWSKTEVALALGLGSLFNHSVRPNVDWRNRGDNSTIEFFTIRPVKAGRQLFIDYGYDPLDWSDYD